MSQNRENRLLRGAVTRMLVWLTVIALGILAWVAVGRLLVGISARF